MDIPKWCHDLMLQEDWVILDTETTGTDSDAEIIEFAIISKHGEVLLDQLIRPFGKINPLAQRVHGIDEEMLARKPSFAAVLPEIIKVLEQFKRVVVYNAEFDHRMLKQSAQRAGAHLFMSIKAPDLYELSQRMSPEIPKYRLMLEWVCMMKVYAEHWGEPGRFGDYKWQKLEEACYQQEVQVDGSWHRAAGDCQATLALIKALAGQYDPEQETRKRAIVTIDECAKKISSHLEAVEGANDGQ